MKETYFVEVTEYWRIDPDLSRNHIYSDHVSDEEAVGYDDYNKAKEAFKRAFVEMSEGTACEIETAYGDGEFMVSPSEPEVFRWYDVYKSEEYSCGLRVVRMVTL